MNQMNPVNHENRSMVYRAMESVILDLLEAFNMSGR